MIDVLIPYKNESYWDENELRYCLRSLEKNLLDLRDIYIVGAYPSWLKKVIHFPVDDSFRDNKGANIINKVLYACDSTTLSDDFVFCSDDHIIIKPIESRDIQAYYTFDLQGFRFKGYTKPWKKCLVNARRTLREEGLTYFNYETHTPKIINKNLFKSIMSKYDWANTHYPTHSLYFNNAIQTHVQMPENYRAFFNEERMPIEAVDNKSFLAYNDLGLSWKLQQKLQELFPDKSRYEK